MGKMRLYGVFRVDEQWLLCVDTLLFLVKGYLCVMDMLDPNQNNYNIKVTNLFLLRHSSFSAISRHSIPYSHSPLISPKLTANQFISPLYFTIKLLHPLLIDNYPFRFLNSPFFPSILQLPNSHPELTFFKSTLQLPPPPIHHSSAPGS